MQIFLPSSSPLCHPDFTFGVATAAFQIEGASESRLESIWDRFCATPGKIKDGTDGIVACEHVKFWQQDIELIASLGVDAYRFSVSWTRVIKLDGSLNRQGVNFYIQLLDALNAKNIKPYVTLYHWDLPQHLEEQGGWLNRATAYRFRDYVELISQAFGQRVYSYATLNEPFCSAYLGYEVGIHAPGLVGKAYGKQAAHHLLLAHGLAMQVLGKNSPQSQNGIVVNLSPYYPKSTSEADAQAAYLADQHFNQWYLHPLLKGGYPQIIENLPDEQKPAILAGDMEIIGHELDYLGINYYTREVVKTDGDDGFSKEHHKTLPTTEMGWEIFPQGLSELLLSLNQQYLLPPILITENGAAMADVYAVGKVLDFDRVVYLQEHLQAVHYAIEQGVNVQGYFAWSLMDNFEWAEGYAKRFGIVHVDYASQKRTIKQSGLAFRDFIKARHAAPTSSEHCLTRDPNVNN